jgi:hypothetical protein
MCLHICTFSEKFGSYAKHMSFPQETMRYKHMSSKRTKSMNLCDLINFHVGISK